MDDRLFAYIQSKQPKFNPTIAEGIVTRQMENPEVNIDRIWRCAMQSFPPGLKYLGYERVDPYRQFMELARIRTSRSPSGKSLYDVSRSDLYMVQFNFEYNGSKLRPRYLLLPYLGDAGTIVLRGSVFTISPVLADRCVSVTKNLLYVPLTRDKLIFRQTQWTISVDGNHRPTFYHHSSIHHHKPDRSVTKHTDFVKSVEPLALYMFAKYGLSRAFAVFAETNVHVGTLDEINTTNFPPDSYVIYGPSGSTPSSMRRKPWSATTIRLAVKRAHVTAKVESMVAGFFYVMDHYPNRILYLEDLEDTHMWMRLLGLSIFGPAASEGALVEKVQAHLRSLDQYIDPLSQENLMADGLNCPNIYYLFSYVMEKMNTMLNQSENNRMDGKRLMSWKYVLQNIVEAIFNLTWRLDNKGKVLSEAEIESRFNRFLNPELIYQINSNHGEVATESSPSDSKVIRFTSKVIPQSETTRRSSRGSDHGENFSDPSLRLHASIAACGSYLYLPKASPVGTSRANVYGEVTHHGDLIIPEEFRPLLDSVQEQITKDQE